MGKTDRNAGVVFLALSLASAFLSGFLASWKEAGIGNIPFFGAISAVLGIVAIFFIQTGSLGGIARSSFSVTELKKGQIYTFLFEMFQNEENRWLVCIRLPDNSELVFYSEKSLKFTLGEKTHFSVIEGGRIIPLDENGNKATKPSETLPNEAAIAPTPA